MMSIFSPPSSFTIACTRRPRCPMHAPRASRPACRARTAIFVRGARLEVADLRVDDVALAIGVLGEDLLALRLAERLLDDLLRGLRADPAERGGRLFKRHDLAQLDVGLDALRRVELDLDLGILDLLDDGLQQIDPERAGLHIDLDVDVLLIAVRALDRSGDDVADDLFWETLLRRELREAGDELSVHCGNSLGQSLGVAERAPASRSSPPIHLRRATKKVGATHFSVPDAAPGPAGRQDQLYQKVEEPW